MNTASIFVTAQYWRPKSLSEEHLLWRKFAAVHRLENRVEPLFVANLQIFKLQLPPFCFCNPFQKRVFWSALQPYSSPFPYPYNSSGS